MTDFLIQMDSEEEKGPNRLADILTGLTTKYRGLSLDLTDPRTFELALPELWEQAKDRASARLASKERSSQ